MTQEKKYLVESFSEIEKMLDTLGAKRAGESTTTHYYAQQPGKDVVKLVEYHNNCEIHELSESGGRFALTMRVPVKDVKAGLERLKGRGFDKASLVKMHQTDWKLG